MFFCFFLKFTFGYYFEGKIGKSEVFRDIMDQEIDFSNIDYLNFTFNSNNNALFIYNSNDFLISIYSKDKLVERRKTQFGYIFLKKEIDFVVAEKEKGSEVKSIKFTVVPKAKQSSDNFYAIQSLYNFSMYSPQSKEEFNLTLKKGTNRFIFVSPIKHDFTIYTRLSSCKKNHLILGNNDRQEIVFDLNRGNISCEQMQTFMFEYEIEDEIDPEAFFAIIAEPLQTKERIPEVYNANLSLYETGFYLPMIKDTLSMIPATDKLCIYSTELDEGNICKQYPTVSSLYASVLFKNYLKEGHSDVFAYIVGSEVKLSILEDCNVHIEGLSKDADIALDVSKLLSVDFKNIKAVIEKPTEGRKVPYIHIENSEITPKVSLEGVVIESDYSSLKDAALVSCKTLKLSGKINNSNGKCVVEAEENVYLNNCTELKYDKGFITYGMMSFASYKSLNINEKKFSLFAETEINDPINICLASNSIDLKGKINQNLILSLTNDASIASEGTPTIKIVGDVSVTMMSQTALIINWNDLVSCTSAKVDCADLYRITINDKTIEITNKTKTAVIPTEIKMITFENVVQGGFIEIEKGKQLTNVPECFNFIIDDKTATMLKDWGSYEGKNDLVLTAVGGVFLINCSEPITPSKVVLKQPDGNIVSIDSIISVSAMPTPKVYNYSTEIKVGSASICLIVFGILLIIFCTPCGNKMGLSTYGPLGVKLNKYDLYDDDEASMIF